MLANRARGEGETSMASLPYAGQCCVQDVEPGEEGQRRPTQSEDAIT